MAENQESVLVELNKMPLNTSVNFKLRDAAAIKNGENQYGNWYLWVGEFDNVIAIQGRGKTAKNLSNYTGEAIFFVKEAQNKTLEQMADGKKNVTVSITRKPDVLVDKATGKERPYVKSEFSKITDGVVNASNMNDVEVQIFSDALNLIKKGYPITEEIMIKQCASKSISEERAKELFFLLEKEK